MGLMMLMLIACCVSYSKAFTSPLQFKVRAVHPKRNSALPATYAPIFDFTFANTTIKEKSASSFERIDDAIMGGISTSSLRDIPAKPYASWSGICRTDGGGFCGTRTLPFETPLNATGYNGIFLDAKLASDNEADRRMWKVTVRTDSSRGEQVYQAQFDLGKAIKEVDNSANIEGWAKVLVPFDNFQLVRGPRLVPNGPKLDLSGGLYQIGMTMSKFKIAVNTTELENFRPGFFEVHIQKIGFYKNDDENMNYIAKSSVPNTLSKEQAGKKRPLILKFLLPVAKVFFSEQANRRKSAMKILRKSRNMSRARAILFGIKVRKRSMGVVASVFKTIGILGVDSFRMVVGSALRIVLVYPLRFVGATIRMIRKALGMKVKTPNDQ